MLDKREKLINECINALEEIHRANGFKVISRETLREIISIYARRHSPPDKPTFTTPKSNFVNVPPPPMSMQGIMKKNQENKERLARERKKDNVIVLRSSRLKY